MKTAVIERLLCLLDVRMHAIAMCDVSPGTRLRLPPMETVLVHYVLKGEGSLVGEDGTMVRFGLDSLIFLPPGEGHDLSENGSEGEVIMWKEVARPLGDGLMSFATSAEPSIITACATISSDCSGVDLFGSLREPVLEQLPQEPIVRAALTSILEELQSPRFGTKALAEALMKQCLILALRNQVERGDLTLLPLIGQRDPRLVRALLDLMEDPGREHTLEELASASGMSRSLFAERFTEAFERPPMDLLKQIRLHRAANLLRSTNLPVQVIGLTVGYASRSYFSRAFKAAYGRDPRTFRNEARADNHALRRSTQPTINSGETT